MVGFLSFLDILFSESLRSLRLSLFSGFGVRLLICHSLFLSQLLLFPFLLLDGCFDLLRSRFVSVLGPWLVDWVNGFRVSHTERLGSMLWLNLFRSFEFGQLLLFRLLGLLALVYSHLLGGLFHLILVLQVGMLSGSVVLLGLFLLFPQLLLGDGFTGQTLLIDLFSSSYLGILNLLLFYLGFLLSSPFGLAFRFLSILNGLSFSICLLFFIFFLLLLKCSIELRLFLKGLGLVSQLLIFGCFLLFTSFVLSLQFLHLRPLDLFVVPDSLELLLHGLFFGILVLLAAILIV